MKLFLGAHGNCSREGTKLECTGTFKNIPFALKTDVKVCQNPVKTDIEFKILNRIFSKHYTGDGDILLRGFSVDQSERKAYLLNVNVKPLSNGDRKIRVSAQPTFTCSNSTIETLEKGATPFSSVSIVDFEHVNVSWVVPISRNDFFYRKFFL